MRKLNICLIQHSPNSDNLGVGALTASQLAILRDVGARTGRDLHFSLAAWKDPRPHYIKGDDIEVFELARKELLSPSGFWKRARAADLVLDIGAGDSFADIYGAKRLVLNLLMKEICFLNRVPLVLSPQTIGPFKRGWARRLAMRSLRKAAGVFPRDALSTAYVREAGYDGPLSETTDVAMRLPYDPPAPRAPGGPVKVGLNVSGLLMNGGYSGDNMFELTSDYPRLMHDLITAFTALDGVELHLVSHVISDAQPVEDDYRASQTLAAKFPGVVLAPKFETPLEAKSYIAGLDFFAGARMHACIAAFSSGVPVVPMAYSRKFAGLFGSVGYNHTADCKSMTNDQLFAAVMDGFENRATLKQDAKIAFGRAQNNLAAYEDRLAQIIEAL